MKETAAKYGKYLHSTSYHILSNDEDAEECVNDTYMGMEKKADGTYHGWKLREIPFAPEYVEVIDMDHANCPCKKKSCVRHGNCDECRKHHAASKKQRPVACESKNRL